MTGIQTTEAPPLATTEFNEFGGELLPASLGYEHCSHDLAKRRCAR
jgi:hypothetical protein